MKFEETIRGTGLEPGMHATTVISGRKTERIQTYSG
jgi:hypothetical protein